MNKKSRGSKGIENHALRGLQLNLKNKQGRGSKGIGNHMIKWLEIKLRKKVHKDIKIVKIICHNGVQNK